MVIIGNLVVGVTTLTFVSCSLVTRLLELVTVIVGNLVVGVTTLTFISCGLVTRPLELVASMLSHWFWWFTWKILFVIPNTWKYFTYKIFYFKTNEVKIYTIFKGLPMFGFLFFDNQNTFKFSYLEILNNRVRHIKFTNFKTPKF